METSIIAATNITNIADCILELVSNSLNANATAIAIRIKNSEREIQVIDNGVGIPKVELEKIAEYSNDSFNYSNIHEICNQRKQTLLNIRRLSNAMWVTSKYYNSSNTYLKYFKVYEKPKFFEVKNRLCQGTTVIIFGFHELCLNESNIASMYHLIGNIAIANRQTSFSIRDNDKMRITMGISKRYHPTDILKCIYAKEVLLHKLWYIKSLKRYDIKFGAYIGLTEVAATQYIFLNNKLVHCPYILQLVSTIFIDTLKFVGEKLENQILTKETVFILLFIVCDTKCISTIENGRRTLIFPKTQDLLQIITREIVKLFAKNVEPLSAANSRYVFNEQFRTKALAANFPPLIVPVFNNISISASYLKYSRLEEQFENNEISLCSQTLSMFNDISISRYSKESNEQFQSHKSSLCPQSSTSMFIDMSISKYSKESNEQFQSHESSLCSQLITPVSQNENIQLTLSEWSDWPLPNSLKRVESSANSIKFYKRFDFLPKKLHKLLRGTGKLVKTDVLYKYNGSPCSSKLKFGLKIPDLLPHQEIDVRLCKAVERYHQFTLDKEHLKNVKILGQLNNEFIVGLIIKNNMKMLLIMDQHAIHERIRYEQLLNEYKTHAKNQLFSVKLKDPITIQVSVENWTLLFYNQEILKKFGLSVSIMNNDTVSILAVPECLRKNKYNFDELKLKLNIQNLLNELLQNIASYKSRQVNILPPTIHNAIATEACHGIYSSIFSQIICKIICNTTSIIRIVNCLNCYYIKRIIIQF